MSRDEVQKLLGGYATGTLTPEEQKALFAAALEDQELFDALAHEQSLRDLLRDPAAKAHVLAALDAPRARGRWIGWVRRPWVAGLAMAGIAAVSIAVWRGQRSPEPQTQIIANVQPQPQAPPANEPAAPAPRAASRVEAPRDRDLRTRVKPQAPPPVATAPIAPPAAPLSDLKDAAAAPVIAENKQAELRLDKARDQLSVQNGAQITTLNGLQNSQTGAPSPMAQNMANVSQQQQSFRSGDAPLVLNAPTFAVQEKAAGGGGVGARQKAEAAAVPLKFTILRDNNSEADAATPLSAGEAVKLRIVPGSDGFLYVMEGATTLAQAQVKAQQQFETQALKSDAPGQRRLRVILSLTPIAPGIAGAFVGGSLQESAKKATLARTTAAVPLPIEQSIILTWR